MRRRQRTILYSHAPSLDAICALQAEIEPCHVAVVHGPHQTNTCTHIRINMIGDGKDRCLIVGIFMYFHSSCDSHPNFHKHPQTKFGDPSAKEIHFCGLCAEVGGERFAYRVGWDAVFVVWIFLHAVLGWLWLFLTNSLGETYLALKFVVLSTFSDRVSEIGCCNLDMFTW